MSPTPPTRAPLGDVRIPSILSAKTRGLLKSIKTVVSHHHVTTLPPQPGRALRASGVTATSTVAYRPHPRITMAIALNFPWTYPVRVIQVVFAIIILGLTAYIISDATGGYVDIINFMLFNAVWTAFVATPYLAAGPVLVPNFPHRFVVPAVDAVTALFWFAGFIALATWLPPPKYCSSGLCNAGQAAVAFGAFEWALFLATTVYNTLRALRNRSSEGPTAVP
ncbi:membrane-associating domain-containing protein [Aspergillus ambiguus]|uniref:MARVEL domain-containing protein n=1 Tax=Aspergillus ambiguus TaxID=176160 RepID=UPI003CCCFA1F